MNFVDKEYTNLHNVAVNYFDEYANAEPFPHIILDNFFNEDLLKKVIYEFPNNLDKIGIDNDADPQKNKFTLNDSSKFGNNTKTFFNFTNSYEFINFLNKISGIKEPLVSDPYFVGGGLHELRNGGYLNIHSDFNRHPKMKLDRRLNLLIYLNKDWKNSFGGQLELWDKDMTKCCKSITPEFNRMVIFSTNSFSYHGNPNKIDCPSNLTRKSLALYYYSNGRPENELELGDHTTIFRKRPKSEDEDTSIRFKKLFGKFYVKIKN